MNLIELTTPDAASLPVRELADHLRMGTGFADDGSQDDVLEAYLRAAISAIEGRTGKVLLEKSYSWDLTRWFEDGRQGLPVAPATAITSVTLMTAAGETVVDTAAYWLQPDVYRSEIMGTPLPSIPAGGSARIVFVAGFGPAWTDVPSDLRQAVLMLAASYYENRGDVTMGGLTMPFGVMALIEKYRTVRLLGDRL